MNLEHSQNPKGLKHIHKFISFVKEDYLWYVDLPEFLEQGLGEKGNLLMIAGADTFLEMHSGGKQRIGMEISDSSFEGAQTLVNFGTGTDKELLRKHHHPLVESGGYYLETISKHEMWLCPTLLYVFESQNYPSVIYFKFIDEMGNN